MALVLLSTLKLVVPLCAGALAIAFAWAARRGSRAWTRRLTVALVVLCGIAGLDYTSSHWRSGRYFNTYELFHYYVGTKYAGEVGYTGMYDAALVASVELGGDKQVTAIRDLDDNRIVKAEEVLARAADVKAPFTPARWAELKADVAFFRDRVPQATWQKMLRDKGYNASPVWTLVGGTLAGLAPTTTGAIFLLPWLDALLLLACFASVWWAFGARTMLFALTLLFTHYTMNHTHMKAAFLRTDFIVALIVAICMLKKGRPAIAGALTAYSALMRVFPAIFAWGMGVKLLDEAWRTHSVGRRLARYFAAMGAVVVVLVAASVACCGAAYWQEFIAKISHHNDALTAWRIGFKYLFMGDFDGRAWGTIDPRRFLADWSWLLRVIQLAVLAATAVVARRLQDWEAQVFGVVVMFFLVAPTYYYYVVLLAPCLLLADRVCDPPFAVGLAGLFGTSVVAHAFHAVYDRSYQLFFIVSCAILVVFAWMTFWTWRRARPVDPPRPVTACAP